MAAGFGINRRSIRATSKGQDLPFVKAPVWGSYEEALAISVLIAAMVFA